MSASVFKPIRPLSLELPRLRGTAAVSRGLQRVRRVLFEPVDHVETEKFLEREMAKQRINECNKWEFDFHAGKPFTTTTNNNNNNIADDNISEARFVWTPLVAQCTYAPKKAAASRNDDEADDNCDNAHLYPSLPDKATTPTPSQQQHSSLIVKRQRKITDFMPSRKRSADLAFAKIQRGSAAASPPAAKRVSPPRGS